MFQLKIRFVVSVLLRLSCLSPALPIPLPCCLLMPHPLPRLSPTATPVPLLPRPLCHLSPAAMPIPSCQACLPLPRLPAKMGFYPSRSCFGCHVSPQKQKGDQYGRFLYRTTSPFHASKVKAAYLVENEPAKANLFHPVCPHLELHFQAFRRVHVSIFLK